MIIDSEAEFKEWMALRASMHRDGFEADLKRECFEAWNQSREVMLRQMAQAMGGLAKETAQAAKWIAELNSTQTTKELVEPVRPGQHLQDELDARGWTHAHFADRLGVTHSTISEFISMRRAILPDMAERIGRAFGTGADVWLGLEREWRERKETEG